MFLFEYPDSFLFDDGKARMWLNKADGWVRRTAEQFAESYSSGYQEGYAQGYLDRYDENYDKGKEAGRDEGYESGYKDAEIEFKKRMETKTQ